MNKQRCQLYLITPPKLDIPAFSKELRIALEAGEVGALQLRLKDSSDDEIRAAVQTLLPITQEHNVPFILNDRPDLAAETGCDGVHVGQQDARYKNARAAMGSERIVGVTCHDSRHLAMEAGERGADYVAFGAFFPTSTKEALYRADVDILEIWNESMVVPSVAIGGITIDNCEPLVEAGADFLAVVSGVWNHPDGPAAAVSAFNAIFEKVAASDIASSEAN